MAKSKNAARQGKKNNSPKQQKKQEEAKVTLEALEAMSDSEEDVPEAEYNMNNKAKALRNAIKEGKFEDLIEKLKESAQDGDDEIEEVDLDSDEEEEAMEVEDEQVEEEEEQADEEEEEEEEDMNDEAHLKAKEFLGNTEEEEASSDEDDENDENVAKRRKLDENNAFNSKALTVVTEELKSAKAGMPWGETFAVVPPTPLPFGENGDPESNPLDIHDDLKREVAFYNLALEAAKEAREKCKEANIPFSRPEDFFAEMVKTDGKTRPRGRLLWGLPILPTLHLYLYLTFTFFFSFFRSHGKGQGSSHLRDQEDGRRGPA
jgi:rRNA-processing protein EBP2